VGLFTSVADMFDINDVVVVVVDVDVDVDVDDVDVA